MEIDGGRSMTETHKSERLHVIAKTNGWECTFSVVLAEFEKTQNPDDILWVFYAIRDKESIKATWRGDRFQESVYSYGSYKCYPARSGGVIKLLEGKPDKKKLTSNPVLRGSQETYEELVSSKNVPWEDSQSVPAFDVLVGVVGKSITWVRKSDNSVRTEPCPKESNLKKPYFRLKTTSTGKRVLEWSNSFGFQACYLDDIIDVT
jgi:hypothetical protein